MNGYVVDPAVMNGPSYRMHAGALEAVQDEAWRRSAAGRLLERCAATDPEEFTRMIASALPDEGDSADVVAAKLRLGERMRRMWTFTWLWAL